MSRNDPKDEYTDLSNNMRHYGNMRFAQLTLHFALMAGLVTAVFAKSPDFSWTVRLLLKIAGVLSALAFWVMEERAADYWNHFRRRAVQLEKELDYQQYLTRPKRKWLPAWFPAWFTALFTKLFTATNAARLLLWSSVAFWVVAAIFNL